jgi:hypothetical protein
MRTHRSVGKTMAVGFLIGETTISGKNEFVKIPKVEL